MNIHSPRARPMIAKRPLSSVAAVSDPSGASGFSAADRRALDRLAALVLDEPGHPGHLRRRGCRAAKDQGGREQGTEGINRSIHGRFASKYAKMIAQSRQICVVQYSVNSRDTAPEFRAASSADTAGRRRVHR